MEKIKQKYVKRLTLLGFSEFKSKILVTNALDEYKPIMKPSNYFLIDKKLDKKFRNSKLI